jgi:uncharacterized protein YqeY
MGSRLFSGRMRGMPTIKEINQETMKASMKSGDKAALQFARNLHAAIRKKEIDDRKDLEDGEVLKLISTMLKQREDSIDQFRKGGREDLVAAEEAEAKYLRQFLPVQLSVEELRPIVRSAVEESGAKDAKDLGKVMKVLLPKVQGKADGKLVNQLVREALGG